MKQIFPDIPFDLTEDQRHTILHCMRVAADKFDENAKTCEVTGFPGLATQFETQAREARELADRIENAEYVKLGQEEK